MRIKDNAKTEVIFKATLNLVREKGLAGITMGDISKAASIATGTLYIYFKNKDELIRALFEECRKASAGHYFEGVVPGIPYKETMRTIFENIIDYKSVYFEISVFLEQCYHSPYVCQTQLKKTGLAIQPLINLLEEGKEKGLLKNIAVDLMLSYLFGIINDIVKKNYFSRKKMTPVMAAQLFCMFWDGIAAK